MNDMFHIWVRIKDWFYSSKVESDKTDETQLISCPIAKVRKISGQFDEFLSDVGKTRNLVSYIKS